MIPEVKRPQIEQQQGMSVEYYQGARWLLKTIISTAVMESEDSEKALMEIFRAIRDMQFVKHKFEMHEHWKSGSYSAMEIMIDMERARPYEERLQSIDVVRTALAIFASGAIEEYRKNVADMSNDTDAGEEHATKEEMECFWKFLEVIEMAYEDPLEAYFHLSFAVLDMMKKEHKEAADQEVTKPLRDTLQWMMVQCMAADLLKAGILFF